MENTKLNSDKKSRILHFDSRSHKKGRKLKSVIFGLLVIALGVLLIVNNMGMLSEVARNIIFTWQMLVIAIGFVGLFERHGRFLSVILISVGVFFLLPEISCLPDGFIKNFWPLLVILVGLIIIFGSFKSFRHFSHTEQSDSDELIDDVHVFGGAERMLTSNAFQGGKTVNIFGGSAYNLSHCDLAKENQVFEIICVFGGTKIIVPPTWNVKTEVTAIFGGVEDKRKIRTESINYDKTLIIKGAAIFGGGEIVSY